MKVEILPFFHMKIYSKFYFFEFSKSFVGMIHCKFKVWNSFTQPVT